MSYEKDIEALEAEWSPEDGFFWKVRQGHFTPNDFDRALIIISRIHVAEDALLPRRIVSLLWCIPLFMQWQVERVQANKGNVKAYTTAIATMTTAIEQLLGVP